MDLYKQEIIDPGDRASRLAHQVSVESYENCPAVNVIPHERENFRGPVGFLWRKPILEQMSGWENPEDSVILQEMENDGAGGKTQFFTLAGNPETFRNLGWEIITMTADDFARSGRFPTVLDNDLQVKKITESNFHLFESLMEGYGEALARSGLVNLTGEVAIMKHSITAFCDQDDEDQLILTWSASCIGLNHKRLMIDNSEIGPGMYVVGLHEQGYRCNGGTFFTELILHKYGGDPYKVMADPEGRALVNGLTIPSLSYARTLNRVVGWHDKGTAGVPRAKINGAAHITGGGLWGKFGEILPPPVGAYLYEMPDPPEVLLQAQEMSWSLPDKKKHLYDHEAYSTFHGGCGMILVTPNIKNAEAIIQEAEKDGIKASIIGETKPREELKGQIVIESRFNQGGTLYN